MKTFRQLVLIMLLSLLTLLSACATSSTPKLPTIKSFTATPDSLGIGGGEVILSWEVTGATKLEIDQGIGVVTGTSVKTSIAESKSFTLTASNSAGSVSKQTSLKMLASEVFVSSTTGQDSNPGTFEKPLKTIKKALEFFQTGQTIVLLAGTYDEASGETWPQELPEGINMKANTSGVVIRSTVLSTDLFTFAGSGHLQDLTFENFSNALSANQGEQVLTRLTFKGYQNGLTLGGTAQAVLENTIVESGARLWIAGNASLEMNKGELSDLSTSVCYGGGTVQATESAKLTLTEVYFHDISYNALDLSGSSNVLLKNTYLTKVGLKSCGGSEAIALYDAANLTFDSTSLYANDSGISADAGTTLTILNSSQLGNHPGEAITTQGQLTIQDSYIRSNARGVVLSTGASATISNSEIEYNQTGVEAFGYLKLRNSSLVNNYATAIKTYTSIDLGTISEPGNNLFNNQSGVALSALGSDGFIISAIGNIWEANEQGADLQGKYVSQLVTGPVTAGKNYRLNSAIQKIQF